MCLVAGLVEIQRLAHTDGLAGLTAAYYAQTYVGFAVPDVLAVSSHLVSYPVLLAITAGLALATASHVALASGRSSVATAAPWPS
jgi:hypothetical protein